mmetsp:Transcript_1206/g.2725  ORF Transcript_1206/g.2725 Transcript_1206/m.2725 type:complete len:341 (-) Transcript_1206:526-1548(-)
MKNDQEIKREGKLRAFNFLAIPNNDCCSDVFQGLEKRNENSTQEIRKELLDDQNSILAKRVRHFHSEFGRNWLERAHQDCHQEQRPTQIASAIGIQADATLGETECSQYKHTGSHRVVCSRLVRLFSHDQTGTHDCKLESSSYNTSVRSRSSIQSHKIIHVSGQGVDNDSRDRESGEGMAKTLSDHTSMKGPNDLVITNIDIKMMVRNGDNRFCSLVSIRVNVIGIRSIVVLSERWWVILLLIGMRHCHLRRWEIRWWLWWTLTHCGRLADWWWLLHLLLIIHLLLIVCLLLLDMLDILVILRRIRISVRTGHWHLAWGWRRHLARTIRASIQTRSGFRI